MKKEIEFSEAELIGGMREALAHARGKLMLKTKKMPRPTRSRLPPSRGFVIG